MDYVGKTGTEDETLAKIKAMDGRGIAVEADVSDPLQVQRLVDQTVSTFGRLDIFVNNAGIEFKHPFLEFPLELLAENYLRRPHGSVALCAGGGAPQMVKQGDGGRIINISSVHEDLPMPTNAAYCAAKGEVCECWMRNHCS